MHNNLAVLYYNEGNIAEAGEHLCIALEKALKHSTGVTGENCLAFCKYVLGDEELYKKMYKFIGNHNKKFKI